LNSKKKGVLKWREEEREREREREKERESDKGMVVQELERKR